MSSLLATADSFDSTQANFICLFAIAGGIAAIGGLTALVIYLARKSSPRRAQPIITASLFWAMITLGSVAYTALTQLAWQKQYQQNLMSGYGDARDAGPGVHVGLWIGLGVTYFALLAFAVVSTAKRT